MLKKRKSDSVQCGAVTLFVFSMFPVMLFGVAARQH
jgi:hypothetical protein